jgi:hypothetical protein
METAKQITEFAVGNEIMLLQNENSPFPHFVQIVKATDKAIQVKNERGGMVWIPKSGLQRYEREVMPGHVLVDYSFKMWLRKTDEGNAIKRIYNIF